MTQAADDFWFWHIASFRCAAAFGRHRAQRTLSEQYQSSSIYGGGPTDLPDGLFEEFSV
jgi:hypothetical protein